MTLPASLQEAGTLSTPDLAAAGPCPCAGCWRGSGDRATETAGQQWVCLICGPIRPSLPSCSQHREGRCHLLLWKPGGA